MEARTKRILPATYTRLLELTASSSTIIPRDDR